MKTFADLTKKNKWKGEGRYYVSWGKEMVTSCEEKGRQQAQS